VVAPRVEKNVKLEPRFSAGVGISMALPIGAIECTLAFPLLKKHADVIQRFQIGLRMNS